MTLSVQDYSIEIAPIAGEHFRWLTARGYAGWVIITDENTHRHCLPLLAEWLREQPKLVIQVPAGERHKHLDTCRYIWEEMFRGGVGRRWCCLNLGGGVIGDMGGFAAATFKRGMDFVQIPTTLLSQVDASVGGKLGIDFYGVKNSIGLFANPIAVWVDVRFLRTLPEREIRSGYAEVVKHALIADGEQWKKLMELKDLTAVDWEPIIAHSVDIKREIVQEDPYEQGRRKALNFGHTVGHAVESYLLQQEERLLHGEAVAVGMIAEAWLSRETGHLAAEDLAAVSRYCLSVYGFQGIPEESYPRLMELMRQDKKNDTAAINFTLLDRPGACTVNGTATVEVIARSLDYYNSLGKR